jgi:hypothetical protein
MPSTSQLAEAPQVPRPEPGFLSEVTGDVSLTPVERLLMIEALFVHDASEPSPQDRRAGAGDGRALRPTGYAPLDAIKEGRATGGEREMVPDCAP